MQVSVILSLYNVEKYLEKYFENALKQNGIENVEFSIVHNEPTKEEKNIIIKYKDKLNIIYMEVPLEPLYISWNRAIMQSNGKYIACWNVDDLREYDSIARMIRTLESNQDVGFTYGDIIIVNKFGSKSGRYIKTQNFTKKLGTTGAIGGPFFMWRRSLIDKVGYFDEQFKSGGDFDYTVRLSIFTEGKKTDGIIGYFLHDGSGISTKGIELQILERTVIELRYGMWSRIDINYINKAFDYKINLITEAENSRNINKEIYQLAESRKAWIFLVFYGYLKNNIIKFLQSLKRYIKKMNGE